MVTPEWPTTTELYFLTVWGAGGPQCRCPCGPAPETCREMVCASWRPPKSTCSSPGSQFLRVRLHLEARPPQTQLHCNEGHAGVRGADCSVTGVLRKGDLGAHAHMWRARCNGPLCSGHNFRCGSHPGWGVSSRLCQQTDGPHENLPCVCVLGSVAAGGPWHPGVCSCPLQPLPQCRHALSPCVWVHASSGRRPHPDGCVLTSSCLQRPHFQMRSHSQVPGGWDFPIFLEDTIQSRLLGEVKHARRSFLRSRPLSLYSLPVVSCLRRPREPLFSSPPGYPGFSSLHHTAKVARGLPTAFTNGLCCPSSWAVTPWAL